LFVLIIYGNSPQKSKSLDKSQAELQLLEFARLVIQDAICSERRIIRRAENLICEEIKEVGFVKRTGLVFKSFEFI